MTDVGGNLLREFERRGTSWLPLLRSNSVDLHPLFFGMYADRIYHHGSGFRAGAGRVVSDRIKQLTRWIPLTRVRKAAQKKWLNSVNEKTRRISARLFEAATHDDDFFRGLEGRA